MKPAGLVDPLDALIAKRSAQIESMHDIIFKGSPCAILHGGLSGTGAATMGEEAIDRCVGSNPAFKKVVVEFDWFHSVDALGPKGINGFAKLGDYLDVELGKIKEDPNAKPLFLVKFPESVAASDRSVLAAGITSASNLAAERGGVVLISSLKASELKWASDQMAGKLPTFEVGPQAAARQVVTPEFMSKLSAEPERKVSRPAP